MKKILCLLLALLLCTAALAETMPQLLPVRLLPHEQATVSLTNALNRARQVLDKQPEQSLIRAELAELSDGTAAWVVTLFDTATFTDAWCVMLDASSGEVRSVETAESGFFTQSYAAWTATKGIHAQWSMEDKQLYDALYALLPSYGLPMSTDMTKEKALDKALKALGLSNADGYEVGYGYLSGGEGYNGVWEICLMRDGQVVYRVNLDAVTGETYYMETEAAGNG
ncbi:MAG: PepSY domain-containing protein [Clostridiales bacterium]|nr:PepSY domain-containing protein [Clostridiales bacterium]